MSRRAAWVPLTALLVRMLSLFGPVALSHAHRVVQMAAVFGSVSLELDREPCRLPCEPRLRREGTSGISGVTGRCSAARLCNQSIYSFLCFLILPKQ